MHIATYNVHGIADRLPVLQQWLAEQQPDIVCLQDLQTPSQQFPQEALGAAGYGALLHGNKHWNGVAILARGAQPQAIDPLMQDDASVAGSRYLEAAVHDLVIGCLYLPHDQPAPSPRLTYKLPWFDHLRAHAAMLLQSDRPVVLAGDYYVLYRQLVAQGWTDAVRHLHPEEKTATFWGYVRNALAREVRTRMDHLLLNPTAATRLCTAGVDRPVRTWETVADHAPTWIRLADQPVAQGPSVGKNRTAQGAAQSWVSQRKPQVVGVHTAMVASVGDCC